MWKSTTLNFPSPVEIALDKDLRNRPCSQREPESTRNSDWYYRNLRYFASFYNTTPNYDAFQAATGLTTTEPERITPVEKMNRLLLYYLGKQPNLKFAYATDDLTRKSFQAEFINDQSAKEFVDFFKGQMLSRLSNAVWTAKPLSKRATTEFTNMLDKAMLQYDLKPYLEQMADKFDPTGQNFQFPKDVQSWMNTKWKEYASELCTDMANGLWSEGWLLDMLQAYTYVVATANCCMEHYALRGRIRSEHFSPMQLIRDLKSNNDLGLDDQFIGRIGEGTPNEIFTMFPEFTEEQKADIERMAADSKLSAPYCAGVGNFRWFGQGTNTVTYVKMFWRTKHNIGKKAVKNYKGNPRVAKAEENDPEGYVLEDICQCICVGNKYVLRTGYIDNLVEKEGEVSRPMFPITRFMPGTFLGTSESEISRIQDLVDEIGMMKYKVRKMIGEAKGKRYILKGDRFSEALMPKTFIKEIESLPVTIVPPTGEDDNSNNMVETIDLSLDPNIDKLFAICQQTENSIRKIMSVSDVAMGQRQEYIGNNTAQTIAGQNSTSTAYMNDMFCEWVRMNMSYAVNATKNLATSGKDVKEMSFLIGDRGLVFFKLIKSLRFEQIWIKLSINDILDDKQRGMVLNAAQPVLQGGLMSMLDFLSLMKAGSITEAEQLLKDAEMVRKQEAQQAQAGQESHASEMVQLQKSLDAMMLEFKESNANYRAEIQAVTQNSQSLMDFISTMHPPELQQPQQSVAQ